MNVAHPSHEAAQFFQQPTEIGVGVRQEIGKSDFFGFDAVKVAQDDLQSALVELHLALDQEEITLLEQTEQVFACVPEASRDAAATVAQLQLHIEVALAV